MTPTNDHQDNSWFIIPLLLFAVLFMAGQWLTATVAIFITGGGRVEIELADAGAALIALPNNGSTPAQAWRPDIATHLPGPFLYWAISAIIHTLLATAAYWLYRLMRMSPDAIDRRKRLGVDAQSRTARGRDLRPLTIRQPEPGRYRLGKARRRQLATEPPSGSIKKRTTPGAVAVIAPGRSGKTYATIDSANQWQGPAILSSVKRDLIDGTLAQRTAMGEVRFYDPKAVSGNKCSGWSPLARSKTRSGSVQMARMLLSANGHDNGQNGSFWASQAEGFLAALLWLAANTDHTMADVTYWVISVDQPANGEPGIAQGLLRALAKSDSELADEARDVQR